MGNTEADWLHGITIGLTPDRDGMERKAEIGESGPWKSMIMQTTGRLRHQHLTGRAMP